MIIINFFPFPFCLPTRHGIIKIRWATHVLGQQHQPSTLNRIRENAFYYLSHKFIFGTGDGLRLWHCVWVCCVDRMLDALIHTREFHYLRCVRFFFATINVFFCGLVHDLFIYLQFFRSVNFFRALIFVCFWCDAFVTETKRDTPFFTK